MDTRTILKRGAAAVTVAVLLNASPAAATLGDASVSCRAAIAKAYGKLLKTANKTIAGCHKSRDKGDLALAAKNCNDIDAADLKGKWPGAVDKFVDSVTSGCAGQDAALTSANNDGTEYYISCPVACPDVPANPMTTMSAVAECLGCMAGSIAGQVGADTLGLPVQGSLDSAEQKCRDAIAKDYGKFLSAGFKAETACQGSADEAGTNTLTGCVDDDPKLKVAKASTKADEDLLVNCATANLTDLDGCATDTLPNLKACTNAAWSSAEDDTFTSNYELPATICPRVIRTTVRGGCSTIGNTAGNCSSGFQTGTLLSVGWKGLGHGLDLTDNYTLASDVTCPGTLGACGACTIDGVSADNPQYTDFTRCDDDSWTPCTNPFGNDPVCNGGGGGACNYYLGPPLAMNTGGSPTCRLNFVNSDITGTVDPDAGTSALLIDLTSAVYLGDSASRPCPICRFDRVPHDHNKNGLCVGGTNAGAACTEDNTCTGGGDCTGPLTCLGGANDGNSCSDNTDCGTGCVGGSNPGVPCSSADQCDSGLPNVPGTCNAGICAGPFGECFGGARSGQPCDVQGFDLSFAPTSPTNPTSGNSLDCPPSSGADIGEQAISLPLTTGTSVKDAVDHCESPNGSLDCFCGVCSLDPSVSCNSDSECSLLSLGNCGPGNPPGVNRLPNNCTDGICWPVPGQTDRGECEAGMPSCVGGSEPRTTCTVNADCAGGGTCTEFGADVDSYCDGVLFANGHGVFQCGINADCDSFHSNETNPDVWVCPGNDCGTCSVQTFRSCFLDPITISGTPDTQNPILVGTFCLPPTGNGTMNASAGMPGPGVVQTDALVEPRY